MAKMGLYCKAYPIDSLKTFSGWKPKVGLQELKEVAGNEDSEGQDYLFLQENYTVTAGICLDEQIVYDDLSPEWIEFCNTKLLFKVPDDVRIVAEKCVSAPSK